MFSKKEKVKLRTLSHDLEFLLKILPSKVYHDKEYEQKIQEIDIRLYNLQEFLKTLDKNK